MSYLIVDLWVTGTREDVGHFFFRVPDETGRWPSGVRVLPQTFLSGSSRDVRKVLDLCFADADESEIRTAVLPFRVELPLEQSILRQDVSADGRWASLSEACRRDHVSVCGKFLDPVSFSVQEFHCDETGLLSSVAGSALDAEQIYVNEQLPVSLLGAEHWVQSPDLSLFARRLRDVADEPMFEFLFVVEKKAGFRVASGTISVAGNPELAASLRFACIPGMMSAYAKGLDLCFGYLRRYEDEFLLDPVFKTRESAVAWIRKLVEGTSSDTEFLVYLTSCESEPFGSHSEMFGPFSTRRIAEEFCKTHGCCKAKALNLELGIRSSGQKPKGYQFLPECSGVSCDFKLLFWKDDQADPVCRYLIVKRTV